MFVNIIRPKFAAFIPFICLFSNGCYTPEQRAEQSRIRRIERAEKARKPELGMTELDIKKIYGDPWSVTKAARGEIWTYHDRLGKAFIPFNFGYRMKFQRFTFDEN